MVRADSENKRNLETIRKINGEEGSTFSNGCRESHTMKHFASRRERSGNEVLVSPKKIRTSAASFLQQEETCNFSLRVAGTSNWL